MPFHLQKLPAGLLDLFNLKTVGAAPNQFAELVNPVTDVTDFYSLSRAKTDLVTGVAGAFPLSVSTTVTGGPLRMRAIASNLNIGPTGGAGTFYAGRVGIRVPGSNAFCPLAFEFMPLSVAAGTGLTVVWQGPPLLLPVGTLILGQWYSDDADASSQPFLSQFGDNLDPSIAS